MAIGAFISAVASLASRAINQNESDRVRREQNIFNKYEAQRAREWNQQMDSTKYQRTVADMRAAGVNPALAMQGGVTTQAASNATASAANVGPAQIDLSQVAQLAMQSQALKIQDKLANAEIRLKNADAEIKEKDAKVRDDYNSLMMEGMKISNNLNETQINQVRANISKIGEEAALLRKQAATEEERRLLTAAETSLRKAMENKTDQEIKNMVALLPFQQALMSAQTESAKASAAAQFVHAAYEQGLIDSGYITAMVREQNASADEKEVRKTSEEYEYLIKSGNIFDTTKTSGKMAKSLMTAANVMSRLFGGINQRLIGAVAKSMAK